MLIGKLYPYLKTCDDWDLRQLIALPNLTVITLAEFVSVTAHYALPRITGHIFNPDQCLPYWGTIYLNQLHGGDWDGSGLVAIGTHGWGVAQPYTAAFTLIGHSGVRKCSMTVISPPCLHHLVGEVKVDSSWSS